MMKSFFLTLLPLCGISNLAVFAQQGNNWYFGHQAGISFNTVPASVLFNSALSTEEGCSTVSDTAGQLLFYTDGRFVYNRHHQLMPNGSGLMGHSSASNSSIIVRQPGNDSLFPAMSLSPGFMCWQGRCAYMP